MLKWERFDLFKVKVNGVHDEKAAGSTGAGGRMSIDFFVNVFERGLLSLRETRSAEAALWRNSVILPLTLALLSCHCDHHPVLPLIHPILVATTAARPSAFICTPQ